MVGLAVEARLIYHAVPGTCSLEHKLQYSSDLKDFRTRIPPYDFFTPRSSTLNNYSIKHPFCLLHSIKAEKMDRGTDALKAHVNDAQTMSIRQTRRGWLQECLGCEARTEFKAFVEGTHIADALEDASCCCRLCCSPIHPFTMSFKVREKHGCGRRELWMKKRTKATRPNRNSTRRPR